MVPPNLSYGGVFGPIKLGEKCRRQEFLGMVDRPGVKERSDPGSGGQGASMPVTEVLGAGPKCRRGASLG